MDRYFQNAVPRSPIPGHLEMRIGILIWAICLTATSSFAVNPNEIREDSESEQAEQLDWPIREFQSRNPS